MENVSLDSETTPDLTGWVEKTLTKAKKILDDLNNIKTDTETKFEAIWIRSPLSLWFILPNIFLINGELKTRIKVVVKNNTLILPKPIRYALYVKGYKRPKYVVEKINDNEYIVKLSNVNRRWIENGVYYIEIQNDGTLKLIKNWDGVDREVKIWSSYYRVKVTYRDSKVFIEEASLEEYEKYRNLK